MSELDYTWLGEYIESEVHRLGKNVHLARENLEYSEGLLALQEKNGKNTKDTISKITHSKLVLENLLPRIEKLKEQREIIRVLTNTV